MVAWAIFGCGTAVVLQQEGEGGVVKYLYQERTGHVLSSNRTSALNEIGKHCEGPYTIVKEGPTKGRRRVIQGVVGTDVVLEHWWGIRFVCSAK